MTATAHLPEDIKRDSNRLRGTLAKSLRDPVTGAIAADDTLLIKFHGSYQQDDRDQRDERRRRKLEPDYAFMIRTRTPGGVVTSQQWLDLDRIATRYANGSLRLTTRQAFQFHGVVKRDLPGTMQAINATLIDTLAACGDVNRNVLVAAHPAWPAIREQVYAQARELSTHLLPNSRAYYELWLGEQRVAGGEPEHEPLYGETYLPRKFKIAFAVPPVNDVDVLAHDLGFIAVIGDDGALRGYDVSIGGGMGATHDDAETFPRLADIIGFITPQQLTAVAEAVLTTQRDFGNRIVRKRARLKYTIEDRGLDWFRAEVERRAGLLFAAPAGVHFEHHGDRFGWQRDADGGEHLALQLVAGRIADDAAGARLSALRAIAGLHDGGFRLTPNQNVIVTDVRAEHRTRIESLAREAGLLPAPDASALQRDAVACVALPTCGLAMAEAERYLATFVSRVDELLDRHGLRQQPIILRISGCANGCSRPYLAEIALVGKGPGRYNLFLGGDGRGQRLAVLHRVNLDEAALLVELDALLGRYSLERDKDEGFGDFLWRQAILQPRAPRVVPRIESVLA